MMSEQSGQLINDLLQSPAFVAALKEFVAIEVKIRAGRLRAALRITNPEQAYICEGELTAIEELPALLAQYASQYRATQV